jgi:hypothetical protein
MDTEKINRNKKGKKKKKKKQGKTQIQLNKKTQSNKIKVTNFEKQKIIRQNKPGET